MPLSTTSLLIVFSSLVLFACTSYARPSPSSNLLISDEKTEIGYFKSLTNDQPIPEVLQSLIIPGEMTGTSTGTKESNSDDLAASQLEALQVHLNQLHDHKNSIPYVTYFKKNFERKPNLGTWFYTPKTSEI